MIGPLERAERKCQSFSAKLAIICQIQRHINENTTLQKARESLVKCDKRGVITDACDVVREIDIEIGLIESKLTFFGNQIENKLGVSA